MIKGKSAEEIRRTFNITNDFTPEEEAQIKKENVSRHVIRVCKKILTLLSRNGPRTVKGGRKKNLFMKINFDKSFQNTY